MYILQQPDDVLLQYRLIYKSGKTPLQLLLYPQAYKQMILGYFSNLGLSLLVPNAEDNSPPGNLTIIFSKLLISYMRLCQVIQNWFSICLKCQVLFTAEVVS